MGHARDMQWQHIKRKTSSRTRRQQLNYINNVHSLLQTAYSPCSTCEYMVGLTSSAPRYLFIYLFINTMVHTYIQAATWTKTLWARSALRAVHATSLPNTSEFKIPTANLSAQEHPAEYVKTPRKFIYGEIFVIMWSFSGSVERKNTSSPTCERETNIGLLMCSWLSTIECMIIFALNATSTRFKPGTRPSATKCYTFIRLLFTNNI